MLGALMFATRVAMAGIPSVHPLGLFIATFTVVYRRRALMPLYIFIALEGLYGSYGLIWFAYLYVWLPLWGMFMLAGNLKLPQKIKPPLFMVLCGLHGLSFGTLCAPVEAVFFGPGLNPDWILARIIAGLPFDYVHAASNFAFGTLIIPLSELLKKLDRSY